MPAREEGGSALLLVPAAVLVLVVLAAISVDFAIAYLGQRELDNAAAAAANDAAAAALSDQAFYADGTLLVDAGAAVLVATASVSRRGARGVELLNQPVVSVHGADVCVRLAGRVDFLFSRTIPGAPHSLVVRGEAEATAVQGPPGTRVPPSTKC